MQCHFVRITVDEVYKAIYSLGVHTAGIEFLTRAAPVIERQTPLDAPV
jgi:hypothetical protein